jgi:hydrogenase maturation protease
MTGPNAAMLRAEASTDRPPQPVRVEVLICGSTDRADDGAACVAGAALATLLPPDVRLRVVGQLDIDDLLASPAGAAIVIVDAATGIQPGQIVDLPIEALIRGKQLIRPRSSHALALPEVIGLAELLRSRPLGGRIVAVGGAEFGLGRELSKRVDAAIPALVEAVRAAVERLRADDPAGTKA